ncbi:MAG: AzlD domain-containing protein [Cyanobacteria bacterium J06632_3]
MNEVLMIGGMAIATFSIRYIMFGASSRITLSPALLNALKYVPPVVLTAIVVPEVLLTDGSLALGLENARIVGAIAAIIISATSKNLLLTIVLGMVTFFCWPVLIAILP